MFEDDPSGNFAPPRPERPVARLAGRVATRSVMRLLVAGTVLAGTLAAGAPSALAATPQSDYTTNFTRVFSPTPPPAGRWSERLATVPDLDGDGVNEILIADLHESYGGFPVAGRVYMQDGDTRRIMYMVDSPEIQAGAQFGFYISVIGDVNGDGKADFAVGTDAQNAGATGASCTAGAPGCNTGQGKAWVFSGANGRMLYALNNPNPQAGARFGSRFGRAGDVNGDGVPDIIVGASGTDMPTGCGHHPDRSLVSPVPAGCRVGEGAAYIFSGKDGSLIRTLHLPPSDEAPAPCSSNCGGLGLAVQGPGDINGDRVPDQLVDASSFSYDTATHGVCQSQQAATCMAGQGAEYVFSGKDGSLIRRTDDPAPQAGATFGFQDVEPLAPGDVNGDGVPDYYANGFGQNSSSGIDSAGRAWVFSGKTGAVLYGLQSPTPTPGGQFGWTMAKTTYDHDGRPDLYVGSSPHHTSGPGVDQSGGTFVFDGMDGSLLKTLKLPPSDAQSGGASSVPGVSVNNGSNLGWGLAAPGDLNGDGQPDYVAGAPFEDVGASPCQAPTPGCTQDVGMEYFFLSHLNRVVPVRIGLSTHRRHIGGGRTVVSFKGKIYLGSAFNPAFCYGKVDITVKHGSHTVATKVVSVGYRRCTFSQSVTVRNGQLNNDGGRVYAHFRGNKFVFPFTSFGAKF